MSAKETVGAVLVLIAGVLIYFGIQLLSSPNAIGGTNIPLSVVGIGLIIGMVALIIWFIKTKLR